MSDDYFSYEDEKNFGDYGDDKDDEPKTKSWLFSDDDYEKKDDEIDINFEGSDEEEGVEKHTREDKGEDIENAEDEMEDFQDLIYSTGERVVILHKNEEKLVTIENIDGRKIVAYDKKDKIEITDRDIIARVYGVGNVVVVSGKRNKKGIIKEVNDEGYIINIDGKNKKVEFLDVVGLFEKSEEVSYNKGDVVTILNPFKGEFYKKATIIGDAEEEGFDGYVVEVDGKQINVLQNEIIGFYEKTAQHYKERAEINTTWLGRKVIFYVKNKGFSWGVLKNIADNYVEVERVQKTRVGNIETKIRKIYKTKPSFIYLAGQGLYISSAKKEGEGFVFDIGKNNSSVFVKVGTRGQYCNFKDMKKLDLEPLEKDTIIAFYEESESKFKYGKINRVIGGGEYEIISPRIPKIKGVKVSTNVGIREAARLEQKKTSEHKSGYKKYEEIIEDILSRRELKKSETIIKSRGYIFREGEKVKILVRQDSKRIVLLGVEKIKSYIFSPNIIIWDGSRLDKNLIYSNEIPDENYLGVVSKEKLRDALKTIGAEMDGDLTTLNEEKFQELVEKYDIKLDKEDIEEEKKYFLNIEKDKRDMKIDMLRRILNRLESLKKNLDAGSWAKQVNLVAKTMNMDRSLDDSELKDESLVNKFYVELKNEINKRIKSLKYDDINIDEKQILYRKLREKIISDMIFSNKIKNMDLEQMKKFAEENDIEVKKDDTLEKLKRRIFGKIKIIKGESIELPKKMKLLGYEPFRKRSVGFGEKLARDDRLIEKMEMMGYEPLKRNRRWDEKVIKLDKNFIDLVKSINSMSVNQIIEENLGDAKNIKMMKVYEKMELFLLSYQLDDLSNEELKEMADITNQEANVEKIINYITESIGVDAQDRDGKEVLEETIKKVRRIKEFLIESIKSKMVDIIIESEEETKKFIQKYKPVLPEVLDIKKDTLIKDIPYQKMETIRKTVVNMYLNVLKTKNINKYLYPRIERIEDLPYEQINERIVVDEIIDSVINGEELSVEFEKEWKLKPVKYGKEEVIDNIEFALNSLKIYDTEIKEGRFVQKARDLTLSEATGNDVINAIKDYQHLPMILKLDIINKIRRTRNTLVDVYGQLKGTPLYELLAGCIDSYFDSFKINVLSREQVKEKLKNNNLLEDLDSQPLKLYSLMPQGVYLLSIVKKYNTVEMLSAFTQNLFKEVSEILNRNNISTKYIMDGNYEDLNQRLKFKDDIFIELLTSGPITKTVFEDTFAHYLDILPAKNFINKIKSLTLYNFALQLVRSNQVPKYIKDNVTRKYKKIIRAKYDKKIDLEGVKVLEKKVFSESTTIESYISMMMFPYIFLNNDYAKMFNIGVLEGAIKIENLDNVDYNTLIPEIIVPYNINLSKLTDDSRPIVRDLDSYVATQTEILFQHIINGAPVVEYEKNFMKEIIKDPQDFCAKLDNYNVDDLIISYDENTENFVCDSKRRIRHELKTGIVPKKPFSDQEYPKEILDRLL